MAPLLRVVPWLRRRRAEQEIRRELELHLALETRQNLERGMPPGEAARAAHAALGNVPLIAEDARAVWGWTWLDALAQDIRLALRLTGRAPGFTVLCVFVLAFGIGTSTTLYAVIYEVLIRPLPYLEPAGVVRVSEERPGAAAPTRHALLSNLTFHAWRDAGVETLTALAGYERREHAVTLPDETLRAAGAGVTPGLLSMLGVTPARGRLFAPDEPADTAGVVVSDAFWRGALGARTAVGSTLLVDGRFHTIIGVTPPGFFFPDRDVLLWTRFEPPRAAADDGNPRVTAFFGLGRLRAGASAQSAAAEGTTVAQRLTRSALGRDLLFGVGGPPVVRVRTMAAESTADVRPALLVLTLGVALLFLASCANVAALMVGRNLKRARELAIRSSLGAGRRRLLRQLATEQLLLAATGGGLGLALGWGFLRAVSALSAGYFPAVRYARVDAGAMWLTLGLVLITVLACGVAPALRAARAHPSRQLRTETSAGVALPGATADNRRLRDLLLALQAALAVALLVIAVLLARSFVRLTAVDPGYSPENVLTIGIRVPGGFEASDERKRLMQATLARLRALPGVTAAGGSNMMPLDGRAFQAGFPVRPLPDEQRRPAVATTLRYAVTPGYAEALRLRLRAGRLFDERDAARDVLPIVVNREFARRYLPPGAVGTRLMWGEPAEAEIVGVVDDVLKDGNDRQPQPEMYVPMAQRDRLGTDVLVVVRTAQPSEVLPGLVADHVRDLSPYATAEIMPLADRLSLSVARPRFAAVALGAFAVVSVLLATAGLYGTVSFAVARRRYELGVRSALGASRGALIRLVVRDGLRVTGVGLVLGVAASALVATPLLGGILFGVAPLDPVTFVAAPALLAVTALAACLLPGLRATAGEPVRLLRCE